jgi:hypothetical protein
MKLAPAALFPLLRSDAQGLITAKVFLNPTIGFGISELAAFAGVSVPTAMREVDRLLDADLVQQKTFGRTRVIQANLDHELYSSVRKILSYSYGPAALLPAILSRIDGLEQAYIYGAWANRGVRQQLTPNDVDVILVGYMNRIEAARAVATAERELERGVNVQFVTKADWDRQELDFIKTVKASPLVEIPLEH